MRTVNSLDVAVGGLGKKTRPRRTIMSTDGFVREGPLDKDKTKGIRILNGEIDDNACYHSLQG